MLDLISLKWKINKVIESITNIPQFYIDTHINEANWHVFLNVVSEKHIYQLQFEARQGNLKCMIEKTSHMPKIKLMCVSTTKHVSSYSIRTTWSTWINEPSKTTITSYLL